MGCVTSETHFFYSQKADGILGMKMTKKNEATPFIQQLYKKSKISHLSFALCFGNIGGSMSFGGYPSELVLDKMQYTGLDLNGYKVTIQRMLIDEQIIDNINGNSVIVDSGTTYTYFSSTLFNSFMDKLDIYCKKLNSCKGIQDYQVHDKCFILNQDTTEEEFYASYPIITFDFSKSALYQWYPSDYMVKTDDNRYCLGIDYE
jgi:Eukaryotic aspartyl protease